MTWIRSLTILAIAFVGVTVVTLGIATLVVPRPAALGDTEPGASAAPASSGGPARPAPTSAIPGLGGALAVTGDLEGTFYLTRDSQEDAYALLGSDGRITLEGAPPEVTQISYSGWEFFPDSGQCEITAVDNAGRIGIGFAELACTDLEEIRDKGTVSIAGTIGLPLDRIVGRQTPPTGGTATVGPEEWTFEFGYLATWQQPAIGGQTGSNMELVDAATSASLLFSYDHVTHDLAVAAVQRGGEIAEVDPAACGIVREEIGAPNPRALTVELTITCTEVEVPGLGPVPIDVSVIVDELAYPF
ncbi:MAG TPA: hypothetical protein VHR55_12210 [Candidatus Limnocylindria bacterium]|nr:hypothetical protein [Candidatus Limnocylindria bacterium]